MFSKISGFFYLLCILCPGVIAHRDAWSLYGLSLCSFLISHHADLLSANISSRCSTLTFERLSFNYISQPLHLASASGPATPDSAENVTQHLSPESSRKAYWRTWDGSTGTQHMPQSPNVFSEHSTGSNMSPGGLGHLKSPAPGRTRSVSDSSAPRRGNYKNFRHFQMELKQKYSS